MKTPIVETKDHSEMDTIACHGLRYDCVLGVFEQERKGHQKISIDFEARVLPPKGLADQKDAIRLNYFEANLKISAYLASREFFLIETVAHAVAKLLLESFDVLDVTIRVTKYPLDMPNLDAVTYCCHKKRKEQRAKR